ncbi:MAG: CinA family nicotinamide mononucleotide deamidase-related protein [Bacteriovoracaceae bacterium]|nr:CinA family nicotinamide mononucleotide deamidase-related protein [Bacteriovoracaceae bacterium]
MQDMIELIIIGSEILSGDTNDTNGPWLACYLKKMGFSLSKATIIPDKPDILKEVFRRSFKENNIVITCGGLGPTKDDLTKEIISEVFDAIISESDDAKKIVQTNYERLGKEWVPEHNFYHRIPKGFEPVSNPTGLAPGLFIEKNGKMFMSLPGVPSEFRNMFQKELFKKIKKEKAVPQTIMIRTRNISEEIMFNKVSPTLWKDLSKFGNPSSLPRTLGGIDIVLTMNDQNSSNDLKSYIQSSPIKKHVWQIGNKSLPEYILDISRKKGLTIAFAESCTGGLLSSRITDIPGSSDCFKGTIVSYSNEAKINVLGVKEDTLKNFGAVSIQTAEEMAKGAKNILNADICVSITGIAGPDGGTEEKPVGTVGIGFATSAKSGGEIKLFRGNRKELKGRFSQAGLFLMLDLLMND